MGGGALDMGSAPRDKLWIRPSVLHRSNSTVRVILDTLSKLWEYMAHLAQP